MLRHLALCFIPSLLVACGGGAKPPASAGSAAPTTLDEQVAVGEKLYVEKCASCHGEKGEGKEKAPALVGPKALDDYHNAKEAFGYIKDNMPPEKAGSLSDDEYWHITAFLIKKNELGLNEQLGSGNAESVKWSR